MGRLEKTKGKALAQFDRLRERISQLDGHRENLFTAEAIRRFGKWL